MIGDQANRTLFNPPFLFEKSKSKNKHPKYSQFYGIKVVFKKDVIDDIYIFRYSDKPYFKTVSVFTTIAWLGLYDLSWTSPNKQR